MKTIKYLLIFILGVTSLASCLVEDTEPSEGNDATPNIGGFVDSSITLGSVADGQEYDYTIKMEVKGPTYKSLTGDVTVTVAADPSSTAVEGTHFKFDSKSLTLSASNNYIGILPITMLTEGIQAPLAEAPILKLKVVDATTGENVLPNGKLLTVTLNYLCFSNLAGDYSMELHYVRASTGTDAWYYFDDTFVETGTGEYRTTIDHYWGSLGVGTPGFTFLDVCNQITIPSQNLADYYSNIVEGIPNTSFVDPVTGVIYMEYTICASDCREFFVTWTPK